jgi:regulator of sirC expression with transglutaminase-like and TPR domain
VLAIIYSSKGERKKAAEELEMYLKAAPTAPDSDRLKATIKQLKAQ